MRQVTRTIVVAAAAVCLAAAARAQQDTESPPTEPPPAATEEQTPEKAVRTGANAARLQEVVVEAKKPVSAASSDEINAKTFELRPHETMQDILNNVPGLIVRQHQGGGKATQYLIRGFNADHGTDFSVMLDACP